MNPQEKALSLCQKFGWVGIKHEQTNYITFNLEIAKELAIIAVDELIENSRTDVITVRFKGCKLSDKEYWTQVKQEIEKL